MKCRKCDESVVHLALSRQATNSDDSHFKTYLHPKHTCNNKMSSLLWSIIVAFRVFTFVLVFNNSNVNSQSSIFDDKLIAINANDLFSEWLYPSSLSSSAIPSTYIFNKTQSEIWENVNMNRTDCNEALNAMIFHRKMMNEFMLSDYLSGQILKAELNAISPFQKRIGKVEQSVENFNLSNQNLSNHKLIHDEGSQTYKAWLEKILVRDYLLKQTEKINNKKAQMKGRKNAKLFNRRQDASHDTATDDPTKDYDDGDVTGYALTNEPQNEYLLNGEQQSYWPIMIPSPQNQMKMPSVQPINKNGYESGYDDYGAYPVHPQPHPHPPSYAPSPPATKQNKDIGIKDITDIALTTLAFLSFGMFILQVLMCITMNKDDAGSMVMLPMESTDPVNPDGTEEIRRKRRSLPDDIYKKRLQMMNELARRVLISLDSVLQLPKDSNGSSHYWSLCENNKFVHKQDKGYKLWMPMWSLGVSWLSSRLIQTNTKNAVLESLKAIVVGLNNGNCSIYLRN